MKIKTMILFFLALFSNLSQAFTFSEAKGYYDLYLDNLAFNTKMYQRNYQSSADFHNQEIQDLNIKLSSCTTSKCQEDLSGKIALHQQSIVEEKDKFDSNLNHLHLGFLKDIHYVAIEAFFTEILYMADSDPVLDLQWLVGEGCSEYTASFGSLVPDDRMMSCRRNRLAFTHQGKRYEISVAIGIGREADVLGLNGPQKYTKDLLAAKALFSQSTADFMKDISPEIFCLNQSPRGSFTQDLNTKSYYFKAPHQIDFHVISVKAL